MDELEKSLKKILEEIKKKYDENKKEYKEEKKYECQKCKDMGWIEFLDEKGVERNRRCECYYAKRSKTLMEKSGIYNLLKEKRFDNFYSWSDDNLSEIKRNAIIYCKNFEKIRNNVDNSIMLCGKSGVGKTHLGTAICYQLLSNCVQVTYMQYRSDVTELKQLINNDEEYYRAISRYTDTSVLYIDDFLKGKITESDVNIMYDIINKRYISKKPIIISTEKTTDEIVEFDSAIGRRLIEMCGRNIYSLKNVKSYTYAKRERTKNERQIIQINENEKNN